MDSAGRGLWYDAAPNSSAKVAAGKVGGRSGRRELGALAFVTSIPLGERPSFQGRRPLDAAADPALNSVLCDSALAPATPLLYLPGSFRGCKLQTMTTTPAVSRLSWYFNRRQAGPPVDWV
jgi:hypothetical protein